MTWGLSEFRVVMAAVALAIACLWGCPSAAAQSAPRHVDDPMAYYGRVQAQLHVRMLPEEHWHRGDLDEVALLWQRLDRADSKTLREASRILDLIHQMELLLRLKHVVARAALFAGGSLPPDEFWQVLPDSAIYMLDGCLRVQLFPELASTGPYGPTICPGVVASVRADAKRWSAVMRRVWGTHGHMVGSPVVSWSLEEVTQRVRTALEALERLEQISYREAVLAAAGSMGVQTEPVDRVALKRWRPLYECMTGRSSKDVDPCLVSLMNATHYGSKEMLRLAEQRAAEEE